jgi:ABC-type multidrug transport system ATPase subunit/pSer/pThr/pTyr-binding forkhead associated (FHA) protein
MAAPVLHIVTAERRLTATAEALVTVGRHSSSTLRVEDARVSRQHLRLHVVDGRWVAEDAGSSSGTYVEGRRVERLTVDGTVTLRLGDPESGPWVRLSTALEAVPPGVPVPAPPAEGVIGIGRGPGNEIALDDPLVSRRHAELRRLPDGRWQLTDLGSFNGTFVNGRQISERVLEELDLVSVGRSELRFVGSRLVEHVEGGAVAFAAVGVTVAASSGGVLVDNASFALAQGSLCAVVGPSGAGKSTLLGALTGLRPADQGTVYVGSRDLYAGYGDLRQRIGFVPQDDVVHPELTVAQSLEYAAELRFAPDVGAEERRARVEEVLEELDLSSRRDLPVKKLSGGQRKRVNVALELLTRPTLLFLDEPTSGLDPGLERSLMELFRRLADGGRTVVVVTHSVESLNLCDRVLFLAPGGRTAFYGPPQLALAYFDRQDYQDIFRSLSAESPELHMARFAAHELARRYLHEPLAGYGADARQPTALSAPARRQPWLRQFSMLTRRYARVLASDRTSLAVLAGLAPVLGLITLWRLPVDELAELPGTQVRVVSQASLVLFSIVITMTFVGQANAIREIVRELPVVRRERAVGLSLSAYVLSKAAVLSAITVVQAAVFVPIAVARQGGPEDAVVIGWPLGELILASAVSGIAALALALLVSSLVNSTTAAVALLPLLIIVQLLLGSGGLFPETRKPGLREIGYAASATWGFAASASTAELNRLQAINSVARQLPTIDLTQPQQVLDVTLEDSRGEALWNHEPGAWLRAIGALAAIVAGSLALAAAALRRLDPL